MDSKQSALSGHGSRILSRKVFHLARLGLALLLLMTSGCLTAYWRPSARQFHVSADATLDPLNPVQPSSLLSVTSSGRYNVGGLNPELRSTRGLDGPAVGGFPLPSANRYSLLGQLAGRKFAIGDSSKIHRVSSLLAPNNQIETNVQFLINDDQAQGNTGGAFISLTELKVDAGSLPAPGEGTLQGFKLFFRVIDAIEPSILMSAVESEPRPLRIVTIDAGFKPLLIKSLSFDSVELRAGDLVARFTGALLTPDDAAIADGGLLEWSAEITVPTVGVVSCKSTTLLTTAVARLGLYNIKNEPAEWQFSGKAPTVGDPFVRMTGISALECSDQRFDKLHVNIELTGGLSK